MSYTEENQEVNYNKPPHDYSQDYLTFEITSDGYINWRFEDVTSSGYGGKTIEYSKNDGEWAEITSSSKGTHINVVAGDIVRFRGNNSTYYYSFYMDCFSNSTCGFKLYGNIMSMINSTNFVNLIEFAEGTSHNFYSLFSYNTGLTDASNLILPATTLVAYCYSCMFDSCTSLETAPELPATTLAEECYRDMFYRCTSLNYIKCLATDVSARSCTNAWVSNVAQNGTFVKHPDMSNWTTGDDGIPSGWTVQDAS